MENFTESTSINSTPSNNNKLIYIIAAATATPFCLATFILNFLALIKLSRSKKLKSNRFIRLTLYLSISDIILSISSLLAILDVTLDILSVEVPFLCFGSTLLSSFTLTFSMLHVLLICIERFLATFPTIKSKKWTYKHTVGFITAFVCTSTYATCIHSVYGDAGGTSCELSDMFGEDLWKYQMSLSVPHFILITAILTLYLAMLYRLKVKSNTIGVAHSLGHDNNPRSMPGNESAENNQHQETLKLRRTFLTLGMIICVMIISDAVPITFHFISALSPDSGTKSIMDFVNVLFLINPLCNPIIYTLRIKEFRSTFSCNCCTH